MRRRCRRLRRHRPPSPRPLALDSQLAALPLELILYIADSTAHGALDANPGWVASLCLVSRAIHANVQPILYDLVCLGVQNHESALRSSPGGDFALPRALVLRHHLGPFYPDTTLALFERFGHVDFVTARADVFLSFCALNPDGAPPVRPKALRLTGLLNPWSPSFWPELWDFQGSYTLWPAVERAFASLTHLQLDMHSEIPNDLSQLRVTHVIIDGAPSHPEMHWHLRTPELEAQAMSRFAGAFLQLGTLQRLLCRTWLLSEETTPIVKDLFIRRGDDRVWLDERSRRGEEYEAVVLREARLGYSCG